MLCKILGHNLTKFFQFTITPGKGCTAVDYADCDENQEVYERTTTGFICNKCGYVINYSHNFTRNKEQK